MDTHLRFSPVSVDSASPVTNCQPVASMPVAPSISMFDIVTTAVEPRLTE